MQRTNTTNKMLFNLPAPASVTLDFTILNNIRISIPQDSSWKVSSHWHSPGRENCQRLHVEAGRFQVGYHKEPRTGGSVYGAGDFTFKPGYWTTWSKEEQTAVRESAVRDTVIILTVASEGLERNICSAILDADIFPELATTPVWLRLIFRALRLLPSARRWLVRRICYVQLQVIRCEYGCWEYHGGINALRWWQWTHPFDIGRHPAWTVSLQYQSQKLFSRLAQGLYHGMGTILLGMRGDYPEYNPNFGNALLQKEE